MWVIEGQATIDKFKAIGFKKYAAGYQVSYLYERLYKPDDILIHVYSTRLEVINGFIQFFARPEKNLSEDNLIEIVVNISPSHWWETMDRIYFKPMQQTVTEAV